MTSKEEEFEEGIGIEAGDLASLLCRFEEVTSSENDLKLCMQTKSSSDVLIKDRNTKSEPDSKFTVRPKNCFLANERNAGTHSSVSILPINSNYSNPTFIEPSLCQTEPINKTAALLCLNTETKLAHIHSKQSETTVTESWNKFTADMLEEVASSACASLRPEESNFNKNKLLIKESMLQDAVSKCALVSANIVNTKPNVLLSESLESSYQVLTSDTCTECPVVSAVGTFEVNNTLLSSNELTHLHSHQSLALPSTKSISGISFGRPMQRNIDLINSNFNFSHDMEDNLDIENSTLEQPSSQHAKLNFENISNDFDHSYCSKLLTVTDMHTSEYQKKPLRHSSLTTSKNFLHQIQAVTLDISEPSEGVSDVLRDYSIVTNSKSTDEFILEDKELFVDSDGNDVYSQDALQPFDAERYECIQEEVISKTNERKASRKRHYSCLQHKTCNTDSFNEDSNIFFDKIPSYYTALSIPLKPVRTTVFASTAKAFGTTDHLDFLDAAGPLDEGHYDKVPAHRRCFTNTAKDFDIECENFDHELASNIVSTQNTFKNSSQEISSVSIPFQSVLSCIENDEKHISILNSHYSKISGRRSRSVTRRSNSTSRFSRRSASSTSDCSTCSSVSNSSRCSTCSVFSRSPSWSSSERESRSKSPSSSRDNKYPAKRVQQHFTSSKVNRSRSRTVSPFEETGWRSKQQRSYKSRHNSSLEVRSEKQKIKEEEQAKAMEERRIVYVGKIPNGYTKKQLYQRFQSFGEIREVKVNFREHGDNYGFVTFAYACDAIAAKEKGNSIPDEAKFDLCFGGRRHFCPDQYSDLDGNHEIEEEYAPMTRNLTEDLDYAALLKLHSSHQKKKFA